MASAWSRTLNRRVPVHAGEEEGFDVPVRLRHRGRMADKRPGGRGDRLGTVDLRFAIRAAALVDRVLDEARDHAARQLVDGARLLELRIAVVDLAEEPVDKGDGGADVGKREETRAQAVVHIMRVISDIVGDRGRLRLEAWLAAEIERLQAIVAEDRRREARVSGSARLARRMRPRAARCA